MFVALDIRKKTSSGFLGRLKDRLSITKAWIEIQDFHGAKYALLCVKPGHYMDWDIIESLALKYSRWIVLPNDINLPAGTLLKPYNTQKFDMQVLLKTTCEIIAKTRMPMYRRVLGFIDESGEYAYMLKPLLNHFTSVKVITQNQVAYEIASAKMMDELGATVSIGSNFSFLSECVLVLSPEKFSTEENFRLPCPLISNQTCTIPRRPELISGLEIAFNDDSLLPLNIPKHIFAGAMYELCDFEQISLVATNLLYNYKISTLDEAVLAVIRAAKIL